MTDYHELAEEYMRCSMQLRRMEYDKNLNRMAQGEMRILAYLALSSGASRPGQMSLDIGISTARCAAALNSLEDKGWVCRTPSQSDRRRITVIITDEGRRISSSFHGGVVDATEEMLRALGDDDAKEYVRITQKLASLSNK